MANKTRGLQGGTILKVSRFNQTIKLQMPESYCVYKRTNTSMYLCTPVRIRQGIHLCRTKRKAWRRMQRFRHQKDMSRQKERHHPKESVINILLYCETRRVRVELLSRYNVKQWLKQRKKKKGNTAKSNISAFIIDTTLPSLFVFPGGTKCFQAAC